jgi:Domain of unknown function (DUF4157)
MGELLFQKKHAAEQPGALRHARRGVVLADNRGQMKSAAGAVGQLAAAQTTGAPAVNHTGLPDQLKAGVESLSGMSMDHVKVHYNSAQPAQLNAHAYAQGSDIHLAAGQEKHLPHEAWHVVQQAQGRVKPTMQMKAGVGVNDDGGLEAEADRMGTTAMNIGAAPAMLQRAEKGRHHARDTVVVQRVVVDKAITGLTHLVQLDEEGHLFNEDFESNEGAKVRAGDVVTIDDDDILMSRRGPNQEKFNEVDKHGPKHYPWYKVIGLNGGEVPQDTYVRGDTFVAIVGQPALDAPEVFSENPDYRALFPNGPLDQREQAVRHWLSTIGMAGAHVNVLSANSGKNNLGVYRVTRSGGKFFVKLPKGNAVSILERLESKNKEIDKNSGKQMPAFAKLLKFGQIGDVGMGLYEAAQGQSLEQLHDEWAEGKESPMNAIYGSVGNSMGAFNFGPKPASKTTWKSSAELAAYAHGDANPSNVFVDPGTGKVTLIDNDDINFGARVNAIPYDITSLLMNFKNDTFTKAGKERQQSSKSDFTPNEQRIKAELVMFHQFARAYIAQTPEGSIRNKIVAEFQEKLAGYLKSYTVASELNEEQALKFIPEFKP